MTLESTTSLEPHRTSAWSRLSVNDRVLLVLTVIGCVTSWFLSIYPGLVTEVVLVLAIIAFFASFPMAIFTVVCLLALGPRWVLQSIHALRVSGSSAGLALLLLALTYGLLSFSLPCRIVFFLSRPQFEKLLAHAPPTEPGRQPLNQFLGLIRVGDYARDPRGGTYFRVNESSWMIDTTSFGFVHRPNPLGSPYGAAFYSLKPLSNDWYIFRACVD